MIRGLIALALVAVCVPRAWAIDDGAYFAVMAATAKAEILPTYKGFKDVTAHLPAALKDLCASPTESNLRLARSAFTGAVEYWARAQFITYGPIGDHQRASRIEYWPDKRNVVGRQLEEVLAKQDPAALEPQRFATTSVGVQGLPALERLLFDEGAFVKLAPNAKGRAYRCDLLAAIAHNLDSIADDMLNGWTPAFQAFLGQAGVPTGEEGAIPTGRDVAAHLLNDYLTATIAMRDMKLLVPLGESLAKAKPQAAEFWRSKLSLTALNANLRGLREGIGAPDGLADLLGDQKDGAADARALTGALDAALGTVETLSQGGNRTLAEAVKSADQRKMVEDLIQQLGKIRDLLAGPVSTKLNLPIGFNALDGD